jgi:hypothetical protein
LTMGWQPVFEVLAPQENDYFPALPGKEHSLR